MPPSNLQKHRATSIHVVKCWCSNTLTVHLGALLKGVFELLSSALSNSSQRDLFRAGGVRDVAVGIAGRRDLVAWGEGVPPGRALWLLRAEQNRSELRRQNIINFIGGTRYPPIYQRQMSLRALPPISLVWGFSNACSMNKSNDKQSNAFANVYERGSSHTWGSSCCATVRFLVNFQMQNMGV